MWKRGLTLLLRNICSFVVVDVMLLLLFGWRSSSFWWLFLDMSFDCGAHSILILAFGYTCIIQPFLVESSHENCEMKKKKKKKNLLFWYECRLVHSRIIEG